MVLTRLQRSFEENIKIRGDAVLGIKRLRDANDDDDDQLTVVVSFLHLSVPPKMLKELVLA